MLLNLNLLIVGRGFCKTKQPLYEILGSQMQQTYGLLFKEFYKKKRKKLGPESFGPKWRTKRTCGRPR